jgi:hypothetical protein
LEFGIKTHSYNTTPFISPTPEIRVQFRSNASMFCVTLEHVCRPGKCKDEKVCSNMYVSTHRKWFVATNTALLSNTKGNLEKAAQTSVLFSVPVDAFQRYRNKLRASPDCLIGPVITTGQIRHNQNQLRNAVYQQKAAHICGKHMDNNFRILVCSAVYLYKRQETGSMMRTRHVMDDGARLIRTLL